MFQVRCMKIFAMLEMNMESFKILLLIYSQIVYYVSYRLNWIAMMLYISSSLA